MTRPAGTITVRRNQPGYRAPFTLAPDLSTHARKTLPKKTVHLCASCLEGEHSRMHTELGCIRTVAKDYICECEVRR